MRLNFFNRIRLNHRLKKGAQACVAELSQSIEEGTLGTDDGLVEIVKKYFPKLDPNLKELNQFPNDVVLELAEASDKFMCREATA